MPCMYWYSSKENGIHPWNVGIVDKHIRQRKLSRFHFDRITPKGKLPPTHDYVEKYVPNEKQYYKIFDELFTQAGGDDIINNGIIDDSGINILDGESSTIIKKSVSIFADLVLEKFVLNLLLVIF